MNAKDLEPAKVSIINFFDEVKKEDNKKEQDNLNEGIFDHQLCINSSYLDSSNKRKLLSNVTDTE